MKKYFFNAKDASGRNLGSVSINGDWIPSHLTICMQIIGKYPDAVTYNPLDADGNEIESFPINPERYLSHESANILRACKRNWLYATIEFSDGPLKGEQANLVGFGYEEGIAKFTLYIFGNPEYKYAGSEILRFATVLYTDRDRELIREANSCSFIDWARVHDFSEQADTEHTKKMLLSRSRYLYHLEEAKAGLL